MREIDGDVGSLGGEVLLQKPRTEVSTDAGAYYCAHILFRMQQLPLRTTTAGTVRAGFIHMPDPARVGAGDDGYADLTTLLLAACRGVERERSAMGHVPTVDSPASLLLFGFGPFLEISNNPSGGFVADTGAVSRMGEQVFGPLNGVPGVQGVEDGARRSVLPALDFGAWHIHRIVLPVDDTALAASGDLARAVTAHAPVAVIGLGLARSRRVFSVEVLPTDEGLVTSPQWHHRRGQPARSMGPSNRWLADRILNGR